MIHARRSSAAKQADWDKGNKMQVEGREMSMAACKQYREDLEKRSIAEQPN